MTISHKDETVAVSTYFDWDCLAQGLHLIKVQQKQDILHESQIRHGTFLAKGTATIGIKDVCRFHWVAQEVFFFISRLPTIMLSSNNQVAIVYQNFLSHHGHVVGSFNCGMEHGVRVHYFILQLIWLRYLILSDILLSSYLIWVIGFFF